MRKLNRDINNIKAAQLKAKENIKDAGRRSKIPSRANEAQESVRGMARELVRARRAEARLETAKAHLGSVQMQVDEAFAMRKIQGSITTSVGIMKEVNALNRVPNMTVIAHSLAQELMKAGVMEEMIEDALPQDEELLEDDERVENEIDKVLGEIFKDREPRLPAAPEPAPEPVPQVEEKEDEEAAATMNQMRDRLEALRS